MIINKKKLILDLCEEYGEPEQVAQDLKRRAEKSKILALWLRKDIQLYEQEARKMKEAWLEASKNAYEETSFNPCIDCGAGNGMGGCTIGQYACAYCS